MSFRKFSEKIWLHLSGGTLNFIAETHFCLDNLFDSFTYNFCIKMSSKMFIFFFDNLKTLMENLNAKNIKCSLKMKNFFFRKYQKLSKLSSYKNCNIGFFFRVHLGESS